MADHTGPQAAADTDPQRTLPFDLSTVVAHLSRLPEPLAVRRILQGLTVVGWHNPARVITDENLTEKKHVKWVRQFLGSWLLSASKRELGAAVRRSADTIQRDFREIGAGRPPLIEVTPADSEAHSFFIDWAAIREAIPLDGEPMHRGHESMHRGHDRGHDPGAEGGAPFMGLWDGMGDGFLDSPETNKSKPIEPIPETESGARLVWGRELSQADLGNVGLLMKLFPLAVAAGLAQETPRDRLAFVALARYCCRLGKPPAGLFTAILEGRAKSKWDRGPWQSRPTDKDTDWARSELKKLQRAAPQDADLVEAAGRIGQDVGESSESIDARRARQQRELRRRLGGG